MYVFRKGVATYVLSFPGGPTSVATFLRAGWSLGNTQQRYIHEGDGSDQLIGRVACGLPINTLDFTYVPPQFQNFNVPEDYFESEFASFRNFPRGFCLTLPYLVASLVHHREWLQTNLPLQHPFRNSVLFRSGRLQLWAPHVVCGRASILEMTSTGIPPHLIVTDEVNRLNNRVQQLERVLEERNIRLNEYLEDLATRLPTNLESRLLNRFQINGAVPLTLEDLRRNQDEMMNRVIELLDLRLGAVQYRRQEAEEIQELEAPEVNDGEYQVWNYGGTFHRVPEDFVFVNSSAKSTWDLWHFGDIRRRICPFRRLRQSDLPRVTDWKKLIKARRIMRAIESRAIIENVWPSNVTIQSLGMPFANQIFQDGYDKLLTNIEEQRRRRNMRIMENRRDGEIQVVTLYNDMKLLRE